MERLTFGILLATLAGCATSVPHHVHPNSAIDETRQIGLAQARHLFENLSWARSECTGIPDSLDGFVITKYHNSGRTDLVSDSRVYVIYEQYQRATHGRSFKNTGNLKSVADGACPVFLFDSPADLCCQHYIDLVGFLGDERMFRIHARRKPRATESERQVAFRVARAVLEKESGSSIEPSTLAE